MLNIDRATIQAAIRDDRGSLVAVTVNFPCDIVLRPWGPQKRTFSRMCF